MLKLNIPPSVLTALLLLSSDGGTDEIADEAADSTDDEDNESDSPMMLMLEGDHGCVDVWDLGCGKSDLDFTTVTGLVAEKEKAVTVDPHRTTARTDEGTFIVFVCLELLSGVEKMICVPSQCNG